MFKDIKESAPKIPHSKSNCTIVSLMPFPLMENKPQIIPGYFQIPGAKHGDFEILHIGDSIHWMDSPFPKMPAIKMTESAKTMAKSICVDFIEGMLGLDQESMPGLFWLEGHYTKAEIKRDHSEDLERMIRYQNNWFIELIRIADDDWAATHQHRAISDIQRHAAKAMGMKREWIDVTIEMAMEPCPLCKGLVVPDAVVHSVCGYILKPEQYKLMMDGGRIGNKNTQQQLASIGVKA